MQTGTNSQGNEDYREKPEESSKQRTPMGSENYQRQEMKHEQNVQSDETQYGRIRESESGAGKTEQHAVNLRDRLNESERTMGEKVHESSSKMGEWADKTKDKVNEWADKAENKMNDLKDKVGEKMDDWKGKLHSERAEDKYKQAEKKMDKAEKKMDKAEDKIRDAHEELRKTADRSCSGDKSCNKENGTAQGTIR